MYTHTHMGANRKEKKRREGKFNGKLNAFVHTSHNDTTMCETIFGDASDRYAKVSATHIHMGIQQHGY